MRAVLDPNVIVSALLARRGPAAKVLRAWLDGAFELVASDALLAELDRAMAYPKLRERIEAADSQELIERLRREVRMTDDPEDPPSTRSPDPGDDYLIALGAAAQAAIVSGDGHLLGLAGELPVYSPAEFLALLEEISRSIRLKCTRSLLHVATPAGGRRSSAQKSRARGSMGGCATMEDGGADTVGWPSPA